MACYVCALWIGDVEQQRSIQCSGEIFQQCLLQGKYNSFGSDVRVDELCCKSCIVDDLQQKLGPLVVGVVSPHLQQTLILRPEH